MSNNVAQDGTLRNKHFSLRSSRHLSSVRLNLRWPLSVQTNHIESSQTGTGRITPSKIGMMRVRVPFVSLDVCYCFQRVCSVLGCFESVCFHAVTPILSFGYKIFFLVVVVL